MVVDKGSGSGRGHGPSCVVSPASQRCPSHAVLSRVVLVWCEGARHGVVVVVGGGGGGGGGGDGGGGIYGR